LFRTLFAPWMSLTLCIIFIFIFHKVCIVF
jgi:hypothetical protein